MKFIKKQLLILPIMALLILLFSPLSLAAPATDDILIEDITLEDGQVVETLGEDGTLSTIIDNLFGENTQTVDIVILLTILTLLPSILIMMTCFTRIIIVLGFIRNALATQQTPPNQVLIGLALFLTFFVMNPVINQIYEEAYLPYTNNEITQDEFLDLAMDPLRIYMYNQVQPTDMTFFVNMANDGPYAGFEEIPNTVLIPAYITSEIKHAFRLGFFIYIPFIVVDMVVASTLMAMGMMMLPPAMISLPFKILLFVMVDGWQLVIGTLVSGFNI